MKVRAALSAIGLAALLGGSAALAAPAIASAHSVTHTLKFTSITERSVQFSKTTGGQQDRDVNSKGKLIGFDELYFVMGAHSFKANVTVDTAGGMLYGNLTLTQNSIKGTVTGGTGKFKGAKGTIIAKNLNAKGTRTLVTVKYH